MAMTHSNRRETKREMNSQGNSRWMVWKLECAASIHLRIRGDSDSWAPAAWVSGLGWGSVVFLMCFLVSLVAQMIKNLPAMQETGFDPWVRRIPWRREMQPTPVFLPGKFHGQRSLADYSPQRVRHNWMANTKHSCDTFSTKSSWITL